MAEKYLKTCDENEILCTQGGAVDRFFILRKGRVGIYMNPETATPPSYTILSAGCKIAEIDEPGAILGEAGLFLGIRIASIVALLPGTVVEHVMVGAEGAQRLIESQPAMGQTLCRSLALRLRGISGDMRHVFAAASRITTMQKRMATAYVRFVNQVKKTVTMSESTLILLNECQNSELFRQGVALQHEDNETQAFLKREIAHRRTGEINLEPGMVLCHYGEIGRCMYLLLAGLLEVRLGQETVATVEPGEFVGELAVLLKEAPYRSAEIRAVRQSRVAVITMEGFLKTSESHPQLLIRIGRLLSKRIYLANRLSCQSEAGAGVDQRLLDGTIASYEELREVCSGREELRATEREIRELLKQAREARLPPGDPGAKVPGA